MLGWSAEYMTNAGAVSAPAQTTVDGAGSSVGVPEVSPKACL